MVTAPPPGRNAPCRCGSGLKYKKCCWSKDQDALAATINKRPAAPAEDAPPVATLDPLPPLDAPDPVSSDPTDLPEAGGSANFNSLMLIAAISAVAGVIVAVFSTAGNGLLTFGVGVVAAFLWHVRHPPPPRSDSAS
jgi:hypothetical protein